MHKKTKKWLITFALIVVVLFGIFMMITVPEVNTIEEVEQVNELEQTEQ